MSRRWASVRSPVDGVAELAAAPFLRRPQPADDLDRSRRRGRDVGAERHEAPLDEQDPPVVELQRGDDDVAGDAALGAVDDAELLVGQVAARRLDGAPLDVVRDRRRTRTSSSGAGGRSMRLVTWALNAWRSSSRRSCQNPRLIISTMAAITRRWKPIQRGESRNRYMGRR